MNLSTSFAVQRINDHHILSRNLFNLTVLTFKRLTIYNNITYSTALFTVSTGNVDRVGNVSDVSYVSIACKLC